LEFPRVEKSTTNDDNGPLLSKRFRLKIDLLQFKRSIVEVILRVLKPVLKRIQNLNLEYYELELNEVDLDLISNQ
jgi:hypothetical protein